MPAGLSYADYLRLIGNPQGSEGSSAVMGQGQWDSMDDRERYKNISAYGALEADPAMKAAFEAKFGPMQNYENSGAERDTGGKLIWGYGTPQIYDSNAREWAQDPSRILYNPDGTWARETSNVRGDFMAGAQKASADSGFWKGDKWDVPKTLAALAGAAYGGEALAGMYGGEGVGAGAGEGFGSGGGVESGTGAFDVEGATPSLYGPEGATPAPYDGGGVPVRSAVPATPGTSSTAGNPGLLQQAGQWAINNPVRAYGLVQTGVGLLSGNRGAQQSATGGGGKPSGSGIQGQSVSRPQFQQNPYLAAQLRQGGYL